jgi:hypothetical protein
MVKYGVPNPIACWAVAAGIQSRSLAMKLAASYLLESEKVEYRTFLEWLGAADPEALRLGLKLDGRQLENVSSVLSRSGVNDFLDKYTGVEDLLPYDTYVAGIGYEDTATIALLAKEGQSLELVREYDNSADRNAIRVTLDGQTLGYVERKLAQLAALDMDCGLELEAKVVTIERNHVPRVLIRIDRKAQ